MLPYLVVGNIREARQSLEVFTERLSKETLSAGEAAPAPSPKWESEVIFSNSSPPVRIFPSFPLLNFISLLIPAVEHGGDAQPYTVLRGKYASLLRGNSSDDNSDDNSSDN